MNYLHLLKLFSISVGAGGGSVGGIFSLQKALIKITIEDLIKEELLTSDEEDDWKILHKKLSNDKNENEKNLELTSLKEIKSSEEKDNWNKLKSWCQTKKTISFKKYLPSRMENLLLHHLKLFCIMKIGEKLGVEDRFENFKEDKTSINNKSEELTNHEEKENSTRGKIEEDIKLQNIKNEEKDEKRPDKKGVMLFNWCKTSYTKIYRHNKENLWKLTNYYCKKSEIQKAVEN